VAVEAEEELGLLLARALDTYSHAIPAMQEEAAVLIAGLVLAAEVEADNRQERGTGCGRPGARSSRPLSRRDR
jgi:hypothetical protein